MSKYPFSQLIREILSQVRGLLLKPYKHTARKLNAEIEQNFLTPWAAKFWPIALFHFLTVRLYGSKMSLAFVSKFGRQLRKESA